MIKGLERLIKIGEYDQDRFEKVLRTVADRRLTYAEVTGDR